MRSNARSKLVLLAAAATLALMVSQAATGGVYYGAATAVYKEAGQDPQLDRGVVICDKETGVGLGGGCLPFQAFGGFLQGNFVGVNDALAGMTVAFQVCIDNNGDRLCTSGGETPGHCADDLFFSHDDKGDFFNPLGPLPPFRKPGCDPANQGFPGYVVFLCEGVHVGTNRETHAHPATTGNIYPAPMGTGFGDFCGGTRELVVEKSYVLT